MPKTKGGASVKAFLLHHTMVEGITWARERPKGAKLMHLEEKHSHDNGTSPLLRVETSWPSYLLKVPPLNMVTLQ
jgi:hypothetical protein